MPSIEKHCETIECLPVPALIYDVAGDLVYWNGLTSTLLEFSPVADNSDHKESRVAAPVTAAKQAVDIIGRLVAKLIAGPQSSSAERVALPAADGLQKNVIVQLCPIQDDEGIIIGVMCLLIQDTASQPSLARNIPTESNRQKTVFPEDVSYSGSGNLYWKMIEEIEDYAILLLDPSGYVQNWNRGAEKIKGYTAKQIIGQNFRIFYLPEDQENNLPELLIEKAKNKGRATHEGWRVRKDGTHFWGSIVLTALHGNHNEIIGFTKVTRDLTERKNAENKIRGYVAELELQNNELKQFNYVASHDLQEPLRKIRTFGGILTGKFHDILDEGARDIILRMQSAADRMKKLIDDLLNFSKVSKDDTLEFALINTNLLIEDLAAEYETPLSDIGGRIEVGRLYPVWGIEWQIRQAFQNLISNSIKYANAQTPLLIHISSRLIESESDEFPFPDMEDKQKVYQQITVTDNGIGFEQQYADRIFQVFQRLHGKKEYEGTGIGLSIVQKVMENHKGYIKGYGEPGKGASFVLYLPFGGTAL